MQVTTFSTQLGLGSELVEWHRDATSVPFDHFSIDLLPPTDDRIRHCTNTGSIPTKLYVPDRLKQSKVLDDEHTKSLCSPSIPIIFPKMQKPFPSVLLKRVFRFLCECMLNLLKGNLQSMKRHQISEQV